LVTFHLTVEAQTRAIDQDVDAAEAFERLLDGIFHFGLFAHITNEVQNISRTSLHGFFSQLVKQAPRSREQA
jgi:hypothetical protein